MYDLLIKDGTIVDGSGSPGYRGDLGICGERIVAVGELGTSAERIIEADGCIVAPGFIDMHSHTDELVMINPACESKVMQGVTTEVSGNCGASSAPRGGLRADDDDDSLLSECGIARDWHTVGEFLCKLESLPMTINFATLAGHGSIRAILMGCEWRTPTSDELEAMRALVAQSMSEGAFGISTGLIYPPGCYAESDELIELSRVAAEFGGIYATHMRSEGDRLLESVEEALHIGRSAGIRVQISHHKATGRNNWGKVNQSLGMIDDARSEGVNVWADQYPYVATSTGLGVLLPQWAHDGGIPALLDRIRDRKERERLRKQLIADAIDGWIAESGGWEVTVIGFVSRERNRAFEGLNLAEVAKITGKHPADVVLDLLLDERGSVGIMRFVIDERDVETVMRHPAVVIGSDSTARCATGPLSRGKPHPRSYGTFPRVLGKYVRDEGVLTMEEAIAKMTGRTAAILSIPDRGLVKENFYADLAIFDPNEIADVATFASPSAHPRGIKYVLVNGTVVVDQGCLVHEEGSGTGKVLRHN